MDGITNAYIPPRPALQQLHFFSKSILTNNYLPHALELFCSRFSGPFTPISSPSFLDCNSSAGFSPTHLRDRWAVDLTQASWIYLFTVPRSNYSSQGLQGYFDRPATTIYFRKNVIKQIKGFLAQR